jgi:hypothetical protein
MYGHGNIWDFSDYTTNKLKKAIRLLRQLDKMGFEQDEEMFSEMQNEIDKREDEECRGVEIL